nr:signal peptidase I [Anaeromicrobium sediminis]
MRKEIYEWLKTIVIAVVIAMVITAFVRPTLVKGYSMYPTLSPYNYLIINKVPYMIHDPEKGDIVVFKSHLKTDTGGEKDLIKRVIAVEGDQITITDGKVSVNGEMLDEKYINGEYTSGEIDAVIPEDTLFVMGDNRENSLDSRDERVGFVPTDTVRGKVLVRLYPFNKIGKVK